jgi:Xaa-Pro aminopeptidase
VRIALARARIKGQRDGSGPRGVLDPGGVLDPLRMVKDRAELQRIRQAATVSAEAHRNAMARARRGMGEWELQALLEATFRGLGGDGPAYGTIVASGSNACVLHYVDNAHTLDAGDLVVVDAGASLGLYAGDITRTWPADGTFTPEQLAVYKVVERARLRALSTVRPGAPVSGVHEAAVRALTEGLVALKVLSGNVDDLMAEEKYKDFFPHQTSHWIGLDVHDVGDYARDGKPTDLKPGMVLTVEPGLYFKPDLGGKGARFACIGVRIEDDVLVTGEGYEVLTSAVPTDPGEVTALVGSAL